MKVRISNKGYTLIEILLVITIVIIITTIAATSFITIRNKQKEKDYNNMVENVKIASELYLKNDNNFKNVLETTKMINLPINKLTDEGYLDENYTINPINNKSIKESCVIVTLGDQKEYEFGDLVECNGFIVFDTNPITFYSLTATKSELLEGVNAYDSELNLLDKDSIILHDSDIENLKVGENVLNYYLNDVSYGRKVNLILPNTTITENTEYIVITTGYYDLIAYGAQGSGNGGKGGLILGKIKLYKDEVLEVLIGKQDGTNGGGSGKYPGGGATIVKYKSNNIILAAAGGGGGSLGTSGGKKTGLGGTCKTNYDKTITCFNGTNGENFGLPKIIGGGGSSQEYKSCTKFLEVYDSCLTGRNTCKTVKYPCECGPKCACVKFNPCGTGSNTCKGGYKTTSDCEILGPSEYTSGEGGENYVISSIPYEEQTGVQSGNGKVEIKYIGETL